MIVYNAIQTPDGTVISSRYRHQYVTHIDKNGKEYMVDGGLDYLKRSSHSDQIELSLNDKDDFMKVRERFTWGTYGVNGDQPLKYVLLCDLSIDHIDKIIDIPTLRDETRSLMMKELDFRYQLLNK